jgi:tetratricopeptide (TPR) repeat protein
MFANHFFAKADSYFHSGYYPSIFDNNQAFQTSHLAEDAGALEGKNTGEETDFLGPPLDFLDRFGRHLFPSRHTHLDEGGAQGASGELEKGEEREILPWLRLSAELDPQRVDIYTTAAFWLRERMGKVAEAETFLREGLRDNPDSYEILFELGRIQDENRHDSQRARNIWELALAKWVKTQGGKKEPDNFQFVQITSHLALLEEREGNLARALACMEMWKQRSPAPMQVQKRIDVLQKRIAEEPAGGEQKTRSPDKSEKPDKPTGDR